MKKLVLLLSVFFIFTATLSYAQFKKEEKITDLLTLYNRMDWRINKINMLVTKHKNDKEYKRLVYEIEKFSKILDQAEENLKPKTREDEFTALLNDIQDICSQMVAKTLEHKDDDIKIKTNELFVKYTDFKQCLKKAERERKLMEKLENNG
ncbi:hypothetical protein J7L67_06180 [bacterium]|nr:hypothetical protein [bacterium]